MASLKKSHVSSGSSHSKAAKFKRYLPLYLMFLPGAIYLLINNYIPMAGIIVAFKKYNARLGIWKSPFCGLANFEFLFASSDDGLIEAGCCRHSDISGFHQAAVYVGINNIGCRVQKS